MNPLIYAIENFILYLTPSFLFLVRVWSENLKIKKHLQLLFIPLFVCIGIFILFIFLNVFPVWYNPIHSIFYCVGFLVLYFVMIFRHYRMNYFDLFFYTTLSIFAVAELWEIPIIFNSLMVHDLYYNLQHIALSSLKLMSVPVLAFYIRKDFVPIKKKKRDYPLIICSFVIFVFWIISSQFNFLSFWMLIKIGLLMSFIYFFWGIKKQ